MQLNLRNISGMNVLIMGLGLNGGGIESAAFFARQKAKVLVTDLKSEKELASPLSTLSQFKNITYRLGEHKIEDFKNADLVIKNPAVKFKGNKYLEMAKWVESDISIFSSLSKAPILAITGTKGKSFTSTALHYGLTSQGYNAFLAGNIGKSPLKFLQETNENTPVVLELSSWQLADLLNCNSFSPHIAIITQIMRDHQNWYANMEDYVKDKSIIYKRQTQDDYLILNYDNPWTRAMAKDAKAKIFWYSAQPLPDGLEGAFLDDCENGFLKIYNNKQMEEICILKEPLKVRGISAKQNLLGSALALYLMNIEKEKIESVVKNFSGLEHRMELFFTSPSGISFYNDSAATIPEATCTALASFKKKPILITGGTDKNLEVEILSKNACKAKKIFILKGIATNKMISAFNAKNIAYEGPYDNLKDLLLELKKTAQKGDEVLLSPASSSFELFENEFDRGAKFKKIVKELFSEQ